VRGRAGPLDKAPWREVDPPRGPIEAEFLRLLLLGESIAPFRLLAPALSVMPVDKGAVLDAAAAANAGFRHLATWLRDVERKWVMHSSKRADDAPRMTLRERLDQMRGLSAQLSPAELRVVYTKAGTLLSAAVFDDQRVVVDHKAYWAAARSIDDRRYLIAILNSGLVLCRVIPMQPRGWRDPRDFDNLVWELPVSEYDRRETLHRELAAAAAQAETIAASVVLKEGAHFMRQRGAIRDALATDGIAERIDALVSRLLG
jgi:hypothetical protein